jgi:hypothetical protein
MIYKQKVQGLLEALDAKLRIIENVANGTMRMDSQQINQVIEQTKKITEQITSLISIERD